MAEEPQTTGWRSIPPGGMIYWPLPLPGGVAPEGFLVANGQAVSREKYARLWEAYGKGNSVHGQGNGSTTFNVCDMRGLMPGGMDSMGTSQIGAAERQIGDDMSVIAGDKDSVNAAHTHGDGSLAVASHGHGVGTLVGSDHTHGIGSYQVPNHSHDVGTMYHTSSNSTSNTGTLLLQSTGTGTPTDLNTGIQTAFAITGSSGTATATAISGSTATSSPDVTGSTGSSGTGDGSDANMPPFRVGYWLVAVMLLLTFLSPQIYSNLLGTEGSETVSGEIHDRAPA